MCNFADKISSKIENKIKRALSKKRALACHNTQYNSQKKLEQLYAKSYHQTL